MFPRGLQNSFHFFFNVGSTLGITRLSFQISPHYKFTAKKIRDDLKWGAVAAISLTVMMATNIFLLHRILFGHLKPEHQIFTCAVLVLFSLLIASQAYLLIYSDTFMLVSNETFKLATVTGKSSYEVIRN